MTRNGLRIGSRLMLALLTFLCLAPGSAGAVVCIGADGHLAVETAHVASCHREEVVHHDPAVHQGVSLAVHGQDHAEPCLDLSAPPGAATTKAMAQLNAPASGAIPTPALTAVPTHAKTLAAPPPPATAPPSPHLTFLKTVVLRT
ncbi:hypothetical protein A7A08_01264 [Methyloligella halotolerans]|uniref:Uncharacterized protein n=1 Tax=Methyloligella halotolerans TaxID=1177755 RepID=A0A1E2S0V6_9HYPH|nr:hypothetical protein [Methyloligella halotolerans]ODA68094.1 hypothetical protein A7A08_01264 [Methyloligella halotolerans]